MILAESILDWLPAEIGQAAIGGVLWFVGGLVVARLVSAGIGRVLAGRASQQQVFLSRRVTFYTLASVATLIALRSAGVDVGVLLGAAGVLTVAIGFASQTSASNIISGLFLIGERPFVVGDSICVGTTEGEVLEIGWLSVGIRTWNNTFVRIPNETLIKADIENLTRFPIRRMTLFVDIAYAENYEDAEKVLLELATRLPFCLENPAPLVRLEEFGASGVKLAFLVWSSSGQFVENRTRLRAATKRALQEAGIEIPFPQVVVHRAGE